MHSVGIPVDNWSRRVDAAVRSSAVHVRAAVLHTSTRLSSTGPGGSSASVHGGYATLSPVSTAAKTMDETLNYMMDNDKSDHPVDSVDRADTATIPALLADTVLIERSAT